MQGIVFDPFLRFEANAISNPTLYDVTIGDVFSGLVNVRVATFFSMHLLIVFLVMKTIYQHDIFV